MAQEIADQAGFFVGTFLAVFMVGAICGLLPLIAGLCRRNRRAAAGSWALCVLVGLGGWMATSTPEVSLCISLPLAFVLMVVILCRAAKPDTCNVKEGSSHGNLPTVAQLAITCTPIAIVVLGIVGYVLYHRVSPQRASASTQSASYSRDVEGVSQEESWQLEKFGVSTLSEAEAVAPVVQVVVVDDDAVPLSQRSLQTHVELALRRAGITVVDTTTAKRTGIIGRLSVLIVMNEMNAPISDRSGGLLYAVVVRVNYIQEVRLLKNENILTHATTWPYMWFPEPMILGSDVLEETTKERLDRYIAAFVNDYWAANR